MDRDKALEIIEEYMEDDGSFCSYGHFIGWQPGAQKITLDSDFTVEELEALVWLMKNSTSAEPVLPEFE